MKFGTKSCVVGVVWVVLLASSFTVAPSVRSMKGSGNVLLVDADAYNEGLMNYYIWPLQNNSANYTVWDVYGNNEPAQGKPTATNMAPYNSVIWIPTRDMTGNATLNPLTATDETEIATYLNGGGIFMLSNTYYTYYTDGGSASYSAGDFAYDYLGLGSICFNSFNEFSVEGVPSDTVFNGFGPAIQDWSRCNWGGFGWSESDELCTGLGTLCTLNDGAVANGIRYDSGIFKTIFFGFPFETLSQQDADEVINRVLNWFATPMIEISKTAPMFAHTGEIITYWVNYSNVGSGWANNITITETYPAGVTFISSNPAPSTGNNTWNISSLAPGVSGSILISTKVNDSTTGILSNTVSADYRDIWGNQRPTLEAHYNTTIIDPFIDITKNGPGDANSGELMTYWLNYSNTGSDTAFNVLIIENYPIEVTFISSLPPPTYGNNIWDIGSISIGGSGIIQVNVQVNVGAKDTLTNFVEVDYENSVGRMMPRTNNTAITNIIDPLLTLTKSAPPFAHPGEYMNYSIFYRNNGTDWAYDVIVSETYPANVSFISASPVPDVGNNIWLIGAIAPGTFGTIQITVQINNNSLGLIVNYVEVDYNNVIGVPHSVNATYATDVEMVIPHLPIRINSNLDFNTTQGVSIGNGSVGNPWVIEGWDIDGTGYGYCIYIGNTTDYFVVKNCYLHHASGGGSFPYFWNSGLNIINVKNGTLYNNTASRNNENGLTIDHSSLNSIANNSISSNDGHGIYIDYSSENNIANNTLLDNNIGVYFDFSFNNTITNSNSWGRRFGFILYNSSGNIIVNNVVAQSYYGCINLFYSDNNVIAYNNITMSSLYYGIYLSTSSGNNISNNFISDNYLNVYIESSNMNTVFNNSISNGWSGIYIIGNGSGNTATSNTISDCSAGIDLRNTTNDVLTGNEMYGCGVVLSGIVVLQWNTHTIDTSNLVNGNPVYYLKNQSTGTVPAGAGQIILANCTNIVIEGQTLTNTTTGIRLGFSAWNIIKNNNASLNKWYGIRLMYSDNNTFDNNTALSNQKGIDLFTSNSNSIINNNVINNSDGINIASSSRNNIYHNNIINNTNQSFDDNSTNNWNASYPICGNYWSNYTGIDVNCGPLQNQPGSDGVGDSPQIIDSNSRDYYPLMKPIINCRIQRPPIRINFNADFNAQHGVSAGNGTIWAPWVIENYDINGTGYGYCLYVGNTTNYFIVQNCYLHEASGVYSQPYFSISGIILYTAKNGTIINNIALSNRFGIYLYFSDYTTIANNVASSNNYQGIYIYWSKNNTIANNTVSLNKDSGIFLTSSNYNTIMNNTASSNEWVGIYLSNSFNNIIANNTIYSNSYSGISIPSGISNIFYHNNIINNSIQATDNSNSNRWNATYPSGGNYWSDYTGIDIMSGPLQDQPGPDGIGDTPYIIDTDSQDNYPLMSPIPFNQSDLTYFKIPVVSGWNLISTPLIPSNFSLPTALLDQDRDTFWVRAQYYNSSDASDHWKQWFSGWPTSLNDLTNIDHEKGVWIYVTVLGDGYINVTGTMPASTAISLKAGWNLVGYPTLNTTTTVGNALWGTGADKVEVCDSTDPYRTKEVGASYLMKPGEGYWVHVPSDTVWVIDW